jgi:protein O-GlcNAcase / histone acetyltransferase
MMNANELIFGVVEGFYGRPWNMRQRHKLYTWMESWGLNTYLYAPKDDLKHRVCWRELYDDTETAELAALIRDCERHGLHFVYSIAPGLDIRFSDSADFAALQNKLLEAIRLGCRHFALLFDDIPHQMSAEDKKHFGSLAGAQSHLADELFRFVRGEHPDAMFAFCPTEYCARMARPSVHDSVYLRELGERLAPEIDVFWTGPEIVSEMISLDSIREFQSVLQRKPLIWDNLHANDYDMRRLYLGPYSGRPPDLRAEVRGILSNPNCEFEANFVPLRTLAMYAQAKDAWEPRKAYLAALQEWLPAWKIHPLTLRSDSPTAMVTGADLELLGDCLYLPHHVGARAEKLLADFTTVLRTSTSNASSERSRFFETCASIQTLFGHVTALENRELLFALYRHLWELMEEIHLLVRYAKWLQSNPSFKECFFSPEHQRKVYRGGLVAELQRLLPMDDRGCFDHRSPSAPADSAE